MIKSHSLSSFFRLLFLLTVALQGLINETQCLQQQHKQSRAINKGRVSESLPFRSAFESEISENFTKSLPCDSPFGDGILNECILVFKGCQPLKVLTAEKRLASVIESSQVFALYFEFAGKLPRLPKGAVDSLKNITRSIMVVMVSTSYDQESVSLIEKGQLAHFDTMKEALSQDSYERRLRYALRHNCDLCLRFLHAINPEMYARSIEVRRSDDLSCDIKCFRALLVQPVDFDFSEVTEDTKRLLHSSFIDDLKELMDDGAKEDESFKVEKYLDENWDKRLRLEGLTDLALSQGQFRVLEFLIRADCPYPKDVSHLESLLSRPKANRFLQKLQAHTAEVADFHASIAQNDFEKVKEYLETRKNSSLRFLRNEDNKSALWAAFDAQNWEIYSLLKANGFLFGDFHELAAYFAAVSNLTKVAKKKIRHFNFRHFQPLKPAESYIDRLVQKIKINSSRLGERERLAAVVKRALLEVNEVASEVLEIASKSHQLQLIFDFEHSTGNEFEPGIQAVGLTIRQYNYVFVAAADLLSDSVDDRNDALGTIAHELLHFVMEQLYDNDSRPYKAADRDTRRLFRNITEAAKESEDVEPWWAYDDTNDDFHAEMIARVPDVLLNNKHNGSYVERLRRRFGSLFDFYENRVLADIRRLMPTMEARERVREFNQWFGVVTEIEESEVDVDLGDCVEEEEEEEAEEEDDEEVDQRENEISTEDEDEDDSEEEDEEEDNKDYGEDDGYGSRGNLKLNDEYQSDEDEVIEKARKVFKKLRSHPSRRTNKIRRKSIKEMRNLRKSSHMAANLSRTKRAYNPSRTLSSIYYFAFLKNSTKHQVITTNYPAAIKKLLLRKVKRDDLMAVFMRLSSVYLENILMTLHEIENLNEDVTIFVDCDDMDYVSAFIETFEATTVKRIVFIADSSNRESFAEHEDQLEFERFDVNLSDLCDKSREKFLNQTVYFQDTEVRLKNLVDQYNIEELDFLPLNGIENGDISGFLQGQAIENDQYLIERKLRDEKGRDWRLSDFVREVRKRKESEKLVKDKGLKRIWSNKTKPKSSKIVERRKRVAQIEKSPQIYVISDDPKTGKSTSLKKVAAEIKKVSPFVFVAFIRLSDFDDESFEWSEDSLIQLLTVDSPSFDVQMMKIVFKHRNLVFLFDDFGGRPSELELISECVKYSKQVWIATSRQFEKVVKSKLSVNILRHSELNRDDLRQLLEYSSEEHEEELLELINEKIKVTHVGLVRDIVEAVESFNDTRNFYKIFSKIVADKFFEEPKHEFLDLVDSLETPSNALRTHQSIALTHIYGKKNSVDSEKIAQMLSYGLLASHAPNKVKFVDDAIAEFLVAQYVIENGGKSGEMGQNMQLINSKKSNSSWRRIKRFVKNFLLFNGHKVKESRASKIKEIIDD